MRLCLVPHITTGSRIDLYRHFLHILGRSNCSWILGIERKAYRPLKIYQRLLEALLSSYITRRHLHQDHSGVMGSEIFNGPLKRTARGHGYATIRWNGGRKTGPQIGCSNLFLFFLVLYSVLQHILRSVAHSVASLGYFPLLFYSLTYSRRASYTT